MAIGSMVSGSQISCRVTMQFQYGTLYLAEYMFNVYSDSVFVVLLLHGRVTMQFQLASFPGSSPAFCMRQKARSLGTSSRLVEGLRTRVA